MQFKIYRFHLHQRCFGLREGFLLESNEGKWGEVSPLPGRSRETLQAAFEQLRAIQEGYNGPLLPSVACGIFGLSAPHILQAPVCLFLVGTADEVFQQANTENGCTTAKIKLAPFDLSTAISLIQDLKKRYRLRVDLGGKWNKEKTFAFLSHFTPKDFDFIEDPGCDITPFPMASDDQNYGSLRVWKPTVLGLPPHRAPLILSSSYESGIGLHQIAALATVFNIPSHPLGIGTCLNLKNDLFEKPLTIHRGHLQFPQKMCIRKELLSPC